MEKPASQADRPHAASRSVLPRLGHSGRTRRGALEVSLLLTVLFIVFVVMAFHDEIIVECVQNGWLPRGRAEAYEVVLCGIFFVIWSAAILRLIRVLGNADKDGSKPR